MKPGELCVERRVLSATEMIAVRQRGQRAGNGGQAGPTAAVANSMSPPALRDRSRARASALKGDDGLGGTGLRAAEIQVQRGGNEMSKGEARRGNSLPTWADFAALLRKAIAAAICAARDSCPGTGGLGPAGTGSAASSTTSEATKRSWPTAASPQSTRRFAGPMRAPIERADQDGPLQPPGGQDGRGGPSPSNPASWAAPASVGLSEVPRPRRSAADDMEIAAPAALSTGGAKQKWHCANP